MPQPSYLSWLGVAKEATPMTAVPPTFWIPVTSIDPQPMVDYLADEGIRASMAKTYGLQQGVTYATIGFGGNVFPDAIGWVVAGMFGAVATSGASAPFTHTATLKNDTDGQPTSYTLTDNDGNLKTQFAGCKFSEASFKFSGNSLFEYDAKAVGASFATGSGTPAYTSITPLANWLATCTLNGSASSLITEGEIDIKRTVVPIHNVDGTQSPYKMFAGSDFEVTGKFTAVYEDQVIHNYYKTGTIVPLVFNWTTGASAALVQVQFTMTTAILTNVSIQRTQGKYAEIACEFEAYSNTTDKGASGGYAPCKVVIQNAQPASTYV